MTMASSQSFSRIQRRTSLSPEPQSPLESGEPLKTMAMRLSPFGVPALAGSPEPPEGRDSERDHLGQHGLKERERALVHAGHAGLVASFIQFARLGLVAVLAAPSDAEGRIAQHTMEAPFEF